VTTTTAPARPRIVPVRSVAFVRAASPLTLGLVGCILLGIGALGTAFLPDGTWVHQIPLVRVLRAQPFGSGLAMTLVVVGAALLLTGWLILGRELRRGVRYDVETLIRTMWLWAIPFLLAPPMFSRDPWSYAAQGNLAREGFDPYVFGPSVVPGPFLDAVDPMWAYTPAPYGPVFFVLARTVVGGTGGDPYLAVLGMRVLALIGVLLLVRYLPRLARACGVDPELAVWLGLLNPLVLLHFVSGAHNDALMIGIVVAGLAIALESNPALGAAVVGVGICVKAPAILALGFVGVIWARQLSGRLRLAGGLGLAAATGLGTFVLLTELTRLGYGWLFALDTPGTVRTWLSLPTALGMVGGKTTELLGLPGYTDGLITVSRLLASAAAVAICAWILLRRGSAAPARGAGLCLLVVVVLGPVVHAWYLLWGAILLAATPLVDRERTVLMWGSVAFVGYGLINGSTMTGQLAAFGTVASVLAVATVVVQQRRVDREVAYL
jgi:alpha-1,6-mannosyltransferase